MTMLPMGGLFGRSRKTRKFDPNTVEGIDTYLSQANAPDASKSGPQWGEIGRNVLGNVGDAIAQHYGVSPTFAPLQRQAQAFQQQGALLAERQRQQAALQAQRATEQRSLAEYRASLPTAQQRNFRDFQSMNDQDQGAFLQYQDYVNPITTNTQFGTSYVPRSSVGAPQGPRVGDVVDGYRYRGGDPGREQSWELVK